MPAPDPVLRRPGGVTLLAVFQFLGAAVWLLAAAGLALVATAEEVREPMLIGSGIFAGLAGLQILCGVGLWRMKRYGRLMQVVFACIGLLLIPVGTAIGIVILIYLNKPGVKALFSGRPASTFTPDELAAIQKLAYFSPIVVVVIALAVAFVGIVLSPIVAAIAIPGLLRARLSANEASAIGTLRSVQAAQVAYATGCGKGGYAASFEALAADPGGTEVTRELNSTATKSGYVFALGAGDGSVGGPADCNGRATTTAFVATAAPQTFQTTGMRAFATNAGLTIWEMNDGVPPREPFGPPATPLGGR